MGEGFGEVNVKDTSLFAGEDVLSLLLLPLPLLWESNLGVEEDVVALVDLFLGWYLINTSLDIDLLRGWEEGLLLLSTPLLLPPPVTS